MQKVTLTKTEWDLKPLLNGDEDPAQEQKNHQYEKIAMGFVLKWKTRKDYLKDPKVLKTALDDYEKLLSDFSGGGDVGLYFQLRSHQEQGNPLIKAKVNKINDLYVKIANELEFFTNRLAKIPVKVQKTFLNSPCLIEYRHFLEMLFWEARYLLSEDEEKMLNLLSSTSYENWVKMTADFLSKEERKVLCDGGKKIKKSFSEIRSQLNDRSKKVRDSAADAFNSILEKYSDVAEMEINSILQTKKINDEIRKMNRPDLGRHLSDDIDTEAVDSLIDAVESRFDISRRFYKLKAKLMGVPKLNYHERTLDYGLYKKKYSFEESVDLVGKTLYKLDPEFYQVLVRFVENGQIDVYSRTGKDSSEFCTSAFKGRPTYIMLNHSGKLDDVITLAHEMGHAINEELIKETQNSLNLNTPLSTAEVASTFMQDFVLDEIGQGATDHERLVLLMKRLNDTVSAVMRQVACYKFEQELHKNYREKGYLSKEFIGDLFQKHMRAYMSAYVEQPKGAKNWWIPWSHIRDYFYVYSYASGDLISKSLQNSVKENHAFVDKVKEFLKAGANDSPRDTFLKLGIDIDDKNFWLEGLEEIDGMLKEAYKIARRLNKIQSR
jgi:oligoendopeptidase F